MSEAHPSFARWLEEQLAERHMSPAKLSRRSGIKPPTISNYLNHGSIPGPESVAKLALGLELPVSSVMAAAYGTPSPGGDVKFASAPPELDRAERIVLALRGDADALDKWLDIGEAMARVMR